MFWWLPMDTALFIMVPWGLCVLAVGLCWFTLGGGRRYRGLATIFLGMLLLVAHHAGI